MATLDQRILIPADPDAVWDVISNINKNPNWQEDCQELSFLSSRQNGPGARWRYASANRDEYVVEITAWYDRLGYEYTFIDGVPFNESRGRIRLQEIPEGTIVEWSLNYKLGGVFSGLRNSISIQRKFEKTMAESLKALYTHVRQAGSERDVSDAKSLMRDAPDYEARAQYVPRHPSRYAERTSEPSGDSEPLIPEPALTDDDTRPNPALTAAEVEDSAPSIREPVELEPVAPSDSQKIIVTETTDAPEPTSTAEPEAVAEPEEGGHDRFRPPATDDVESALPDAPVVEEEPVEALAESIDETPDDAPVAEVSTPEAADEPPEAVEQAEPDITMEPEARTEAPVITDPFGPKINISDVDTKEISIWEVFDVPRPSDTQPVRAVSEDEATIEAEPPTPPEDTQPISASSQTTTPTEAEETIATDEGSTDTPAAPEVVETVARPTLKLGPLEPVPPLPHGFRFHARRKLVKVRHLR